MKSTFKVLIVVRKDQVLKNGLVRVSVRITIDGETTEFSSKLFVDPALWDQEKGGLIGRSKVAMEGNTALVQITTRLTNKFKEIEEKHGYVTLESLKNAFFGIEERTMTLLVLMDKKIAQKKAIAGVSIQEGAVAKYENTRTRLKEFIGIYAQTKDIAIKDVNYDFITSFDTFLRAEYGCSHNTVVKYLRYLKQVTTDAIKSGLIRVDPFMDITLSSKKGYREYLTEEELEKLVKQKFFSEQLKEIRDIFVFCCFTNLEDKKQRKANQGNGLIVRKERPLVALSV